jgi:hypothetical protein
MKRVIIAVLLTGLAQAGELQLQLRDSGGTGQVHGSKGH